MLKLIWMDLLILKSLRVGLPDLHPGKTPVGAVVITENVIYPQLIDNDIGCGMSMFMTDIKRRKFKAYVKL